MNGLVLVVRDSRDREENLWDPDEMRRAFSSDDADAPWVREQTQRSPYWFGAPGPFAGPHATAAKLGWPQLAIDKAVEMANNSSYHSRMGGMNREKYAEPAVELTDITYEKQADHKLPVLIGRYTYNVMHARNPVAVFDESVFMPPTDLGGILPGTNQKMGGLSTKAHGPHHEYRVTLAGEELDSWFWGDFDYVIYRGVAMTSADPEWYRVAWGYGDDISMPDEDLYDYVWGPWRDEDEGVEAFAENWWTRMRDHFQLLMTTHERDLYVSVFSY